MSKTSDRINLTNQFLIAMPNMADPTFSGTVVYLCDHSERGALGLVINRPTDIIASIQPWIESKSGTTSQLVNQVGTHTMSRGPSPDAR